MLVSGSGLLYVPGYDSHSVALVNPATSQVEGQFIAPRSGGLANTRGIIDEGSTILVGGEGSNAIYRFNANSGAFVGTLISGITRPTGMAIALDGSLLVLWGNRVRRYGHVLLPVVLWLPVRLPVPESSSQDRLPDGGRA